MDRSQLTVRSGEVFELSSLLITVQQDAMPSCVYGRLSTKEILSTLLMYGISLPADLLIY